MSRLRRKEEISTNWIFDEEVLAVLMAIIIVVVTFTVLQFLYAEMTVEQFSELGLLGATGRVGDYPREVVAGSPFQLKVYVGNREGKVMYYRILVKVGDKSSIVNVSTPLNAEPIMDLRVVLMHNSSKVIPINITLYEAKVNVKLFFEMWVYDEGSGVFRYTGRWNQLWINVTESAIPVINVKSNESLSPYIDSKLAEAYMAIRRAEAAGGDVSEMTRLLNEAIEANIQGNLGHAEQLLGEVLSLEGRVTKAGSESSRLKFYTNITGLILISSICVCLYLYLRDNIWLLWARVHSGWRVIWNIEGRRKDKSAQKSTYEESNTVDELINDPDALDPNPRVAAKELHRMVRAGIVKIYDPNPPKTFLSYLLSWYNASFILVSLILALGITFIYLSELINVWTFDKNSQALIYPLSAVVKFVRYALGSLMVLFLPGYSLVEVLYPSETDLSPIERLALSVGLSLALVPLVGIVLNYTPWGIRLSPIVITISVITTMLLLIASYRKFTSIKLKTQA
ncbi:MAG: DUF1616 domain-containing protein [Candidatus Korarchaeum sp.]